MVFRALIVAVASVATAVQGEVAVMSSQVGYDIGDPMRVLVRSDQPNSIPQRASFAVLDSKGRRIVEGPVEYWGEKWGAHWWIVDCSGLEGEGCYSVRIVDGANLLCVSEPIEVASRILWDKSYSVIAYDYLRTRTEQARTGKGWRDCGSDLQEFSSHAVCVDGIADVLEIVPFNVASDKQIFLRNQLIRGCDYLAHLQDKAKEFGLGNGAVIHEDRDKDVVTGNIAKAAAIFARVSRLIAEHDPEKSGEYLERAKRAFTWIERNGPVIPPGSQTFFPFVHGAPAGSVPPKGQWMTRDLVTMTRASVELFRRGETDYRAKAIRYVNRVMERQVPKEQAEGGLFGHFYTYSDFSSFGGIKFTEKANIHCGAWSKDGRVYNKGGHYPHYLLPLIDMLRLWSDHRDAPRWKRCLHNFAYGYLIPSCRSSPFLILPAGYYNDEGLVYFGSWYHAHNNIYAFTASMALELGQLFNDRQLRDIAVGNIQWIAGLNCGKREGEPAKYLPVSMIYGIGARSRGSWSKIPGSVCNGFSASRQFKIASITAADDKPTFFDDEAYIAHSLPYLAALTRLEAYRDLSTNAKRPPLGVPEAWH
jgi:hypothetical protein